ncbi:MAG: transposase, partial [Desulfamplus sp.]|nr:transposase [Desulfamplus sp.]
MELKDILDRLRAKHSKRQIHRDTRVHRTIIREFETLALDKGWLDPPPDQIPPTEGELQAEWKNAKEEEIVHPLNPWQAQIREWVAKKYSFKVIHELTQDFYTCSESTIRRYIQKNLTQRITPIMVRSTVPGEIMEVDFGYLGLVWDIERGCQHKAWVFSGRLRHSRRAWREIVYDQKQETFFRCHEHAFEYFGGVPAEVVPDNL